MAVKPYYTSNSLIEAVKRNISFPIYQNTFTEADILAFANMEIFSAQMPSVLQFHEEYYVYEHEVPLVGNKSRYPIPSRAIGMKLRDLIFKDEQGNLCDMSMINPDDKPFFNTGTNSGSRTPIHYYLQNNSIVLTPEVGESPNGSLLFTYYLRPNSLVPDEQAIICDSFSKTITVDNTTLIAGDTLTIGDVVLTADTEFAIGANSSITATNIVSYLNTIDNDIAGSTASNVITLTYEDKDTVIETDNSAAFSIPATLTINSTQDVPEEITDGVLVDFLQTDGGHSTYSFDVRVGTNAVSPTSITFPVSSIPEDFVVGDYICLQYQCIVPQVPTDLHNILAERTCARILEAQGDQDGLKAANAKIQDLESRQSVMIDSRVEGSPQKILNRHSLLRLNKTRRGRW